jgi:hypothetical protein
MFGEPGVAHRAHIYSGGAPAERSAQYGKDDYSGTTGKSKHPHVECLG